MMCMSFLLDALLPIGAIRLYRRGNIGLLEAGLLFILATLLIVACVSTSTLFENADKVLLFFFVCAISSGALDLVVLRRSKSTARVAAWRIMFSSFGALHGIVLFSGVILEVIGRGDVAIRSTKNLSWVLSSDLARGLGFSLLLLSLLYFAIRIFVEMRKMIRSSPTSFR